MKKGTTWRVEGEEARGLDRSIDDYGDGEKNLPYGQTMPLKKVKSKMNCVGREGNEKEKKTSWSFNHKKRGLGPDLDPYF